jgi:hypothetical protein
LAYEKNAFGNNDGPFPLPHTISISSSVTLTLSYLPAVGKMFYTQFASDNSSSTTAINRQYRWVVIPGGVSGGRGINGSNMTSTGYTVDELKNMSYHQVCTLLNIPE